MLKIVLLIFTSFFLLIASFIAYKGLKKELPSKFIGFSFAILALFFIAHVLWFEFGLIEVYPHLLKTVSPIMFLPAPLFYLGVMQHAFGSSWKKNHFIHFLPFLFHFLELIPFYTKSLEEKKMIATMVLGEDFGRVTLAHGFIPGVWVEIFRFVLMVVYFFISWRILFSNGYFFGNSAQCTIKKWMKPTLLLFGFFQLVLLIQLSMQLQSFFTNMVFPEIKLVSVILILIGITFYLFYSFKNMHINFAAHQKVNPKAELENRPSLDLKFYTTKNNGNNIDLLEEDVELFRERFKMLLEDELIYLKPDLLIREFAVTVGVSHRVVSEISISLYGKKFKDLINSFRVSYAKEKIEDGYLESSTVESLAADSGFNSRITFYNVFKKEFSISPTEYWNSIKT
ncbi:AraC family transcriptional regulator [Algoriphagus sp.]|uniref:helix-turn-helix domain-containing protein n=1 Tax=Algoriphagus sp. TaxID=1872435 RepID=UPI0026192534|nr:AraC family transcriptional regulator [Algoriphagus sp.]